MNQVDTHMPHLGKDIRDADRCDAELFREDHNVPEDIFMLLPVLSGSSSKC
jgi:hypothetical protein